MRLRSIVCLLFILGLGLFFSGCSNNPEPTTGPVASTQETSTESPEIASTAPEIDSDREVVALINSSPVYRDEFERAKATLLNQYAQTYAQFGMDIAALLGGADGRMFELGIEAESLLQIVQLILTRQEADERGIVITDEEIQQEIDSQYGEFLAGQGWTEADLAMYLAEQGRTVESFKSNVREYVSNQMLAMEVQKAVAGPLDITDEQLGEYFIANKINYDVVERVRASHILVETEQEAEEILAELNDGADFAELAREHSTCPSGSSGGDLDWFGRAAMVPAFEEAAFALTIGDISGIVATEFGYHIILLTDRQDAASPELADIIDQVRTDLEAELSYEGALAWYEEVLGSAEIVVHEPLLDAILKQKDDIDAAIAILEQAQGDGTSDDPYLPYVLGTFYEKKLNEALGEKETAELDATEIGALEIQIDELRTKALDTYRLAQEANADDVAIQGKITKIEAMVGESEEETP
jgi:parvulin-like peptidyl-prolyl isomerase